MKIANLKLTVMWLILATVTECVLVGYIAVWREWFWTAVSDHDFVKFCFYLVYFAIAALIATFVSGYGQYLVNYYSLLKRYSLTRLAIKKPGITQVENYPQRIQEDCFSYYQIRTSLIVNVSKAVVMFVTYLGILIYQLSIGYLISPVLYAIIGTYLAYKIARPLIPLNYINQNFEASFRRLLTKRSFALVIRNNFNLFKTTKYLQYFQSFYGQISVIVPFILLAPAYFASKLSFGALMQCSAATNQLIDSMSIGIQSFNDFNRFLSCKKRLQEMGVVK